ncbi:MAG: hypothetical protein HZB51_22025 [Chloroflexi bacterium]|nr:hypothetical protein [Chloroflexota bacterium]
MNARWKLTLTINLALVLVVAFFLAPRPVRAATIVVPCGDVAALVAALNTANSTSEATVIELAAGCAYTLTVPNNTGYKGNNGLPQIGTDVTINGHGSTIQCSTAPETRQFRIFQVNDWGKLSLNDVTLLNGYNDDMSYGIEKGGAIANFGQLVVMNSTFSNNHAGCGSAIFTDIPGVPLSTTARVTVTNSTFSNNPADG